MRLRKLDQVELEAIQYFTAFTPGHGGEVQELTSYEPTEGDRLTATNARREGQISAGKGVGWIALAVLSVVVIVLTCFIPGTNPVTTGLLGVLAAVSVGYAVDEFRRAKRRRQEAGYILRGLW